MTGHVYVLECADDCWYVGWSADIQTRVCAHFLNNGAKWTQLHRPLNIHSVRVGDQLLENLVTLQLMCQHGWQKVRGGNYCLVDMQKPPACLQKAQHFANRDAVVVNVSPDVMFNQPLPTTNRLRKEP